MVRVSSLTVTTNDLFFFYVHIWNEVRDLNLISEPAIWVLLFTITATSAFQM